MKNNNMKSIKVIVLIGVIVGVILAATTSYIVAETLINSKDLYYQDNYELGASNVQEAIDGTCTKFSTQLTTFQTTITDQINTAKTDVLNKAYPVGSVYTSVNTTSPATLFGGTWERIQGRFLLSADDTTYKINATGGEATHTLTIAEMPSHTHNVNVVRAYATDYSDSGSRRFANYVNTQYNDLGGYTYKSTATGGGAAHNNMPPYLVVYMWKRTK